MNRKSGIFLAAVLLVGGVEIGGKQFVEAKPLQQTSKKVKQLKPFSAKKPSKPPQKKTPRSLQEIIKSIFAPLKDSRPLGSRSNLCAIAPGRLEKDNDTIWSDRPVFTWRGKAKKLMLFDEETGDLLWQRSLSGEEQSVSYDVPALMPGKVYEWRLLHEGTQRSTFQVMAVEPRVQILADLQGLSGSDEMENLPVEIRAAVLRSQYFAQQGLWSDALQSLDGVSEAYGELGIMLDELCGVEET